MNGDYERIRILLLGAEQLRLEKIDTALRRSDDRFDRLPETLAESIECANSTRGTSRLARALSESTAESLELAVQKRPGAVVQAVFPIIGPAIRRALSEALRGMAQDLDHALHEAFSPRTLRWRLESFRTGTPYANVALRHRLHYQVEHLFLIQCESGLLLDHISGPDVPDIDVDAIAGMLTAIEHFVQDSVSAGGGSGLGGATVGDYRLLLSHGPFVRVAAFVRGVPPGSLGERLDELTEMLHAYHGHALTERPGKRLERSAYLQSAALADLNQLRTSEDGRETSRNYLVMALGAIVLLALVIWCGLAFAWTREIEGIRQQLDELPGFALLGIESEARGSLSIRGLYDPAARDPRPLLRKSHPDVRIHWRMRPYVSSEPAVIARRARQQLMLPDEATSRLDERGTLHLAGTISFARWHALRERPPAIAGARGIDASRLAYPGKRQVDALITEIESTRVDLPDGPTSTALDETSLQRLIVSIKALQAQAVRSGLSIHVRTYGFTDEPGSLEINRQLRLRRAGWLSEAIRSGLDESVDVDVSLDTLSVRFHGKYRAANAQVLTTPIRSPHEEAD